MSDDSMRCRSCHRRTSFTAGTIEGARKPLRTWFMATRLAEQAVAADPAPYRTIIGKPSNPGKSGQ